MRNTTGRPDWLEKLEESLRLFGHRNWIVVADSAYPAHSSAGIETVCAGMDHIEVLRTVLGVLDASPHVSGTFYTDSELTAVADEDAPGAAAYRQESDRLLAARDRVTAAHDEIIARLDEASRQFRILIIKTQMRIPYSSIFIELGCGYWTAEAERKLRTALKAPQPPEK